MRLIRNALAVGFMVGATSLMAAPAIVPLKSSIDFGKKVPGEPGANWMEAGYDNAGDQDLIFTDAGISIQGADAGDFRFRELPTTATMRSGEIPRYVNLEFAPGSVGTKEATLVFTTNDPDDPTTSILLTGEAVPFRGTLVNGPYDGYGPGQSTVGIGGDYGSLQDAVTAINVHPLTGGDWSFLILNDLDEPGSLLIGQPNTSSNTITLRPAPNTNPTVTFTSTTNLVNNIAVSGHIIVGSKIEERVPFPPRLLPVKMQNFVIDGCNIVGGTERNLTLTNVDGAGSLVMVHTMGDADRVAIRNCKFECYAVPDGAGYNYNNVIKFLGIDERLARVLGTNMPWGSPDFGEVVNCDFRTTRTHEAIVSFNSLDNAPLSHLPEFAPLKDIRVEGNAIRALGGNGINVSSLESCEITSNVLIMDEPGTDGINLVSGISVTLPSSSDDGVIYVGSNNIRFVEASISSNIVGIGLQCRDFGISFVVSNNCISGISAPTALTDNLYSGGIVLSVAVGSAAHISHNSIALRHFLSSPATTPSRCASIYIINNPTGNPRVTLLNNILSSNIPNSACVYSRYSIGDKLLSDYNDLAYINGAIAGFAGTMSYATLDAWQSGVAVDANSVAQDPFVPAVPGAGVWVGPGDSESPDLHFTAHPGAVYKVPQLDGIDTDIDGNARPENYTLMGAHQPPGPPATVAAWEIY